MPEIANVFRRCGISFHQVNGMLDEGDEAWEEIGDWVSAARVAHPMVHNRLDKAKGVAKVAAARRLAVRLYWMMRQNVGYLEIARIESSPGGEWSAQARPFA
jgi:hypothetical protein